MRFTGVAEVEYKWDARSAEYKLIEINARPWDQHRLGAACGADLIYLAYCEHAGLPLPRPQRSSPGSKWIAEDTFFTAALQMAWRRDSRLADLFRHARGKRLLAIWSIRDPLPLIAYVFMRFLPDLLAAVVRWLWTGLRKSIFVKSNGVPSKKGLVYESHQEN
jgi:predicted ATP-grasp superfamily ATP-dependent carboligase